MKKETRLLVITISLLLIVGIILSISFFSGIDVLLATFIYFFFLVLFIVVVYFLRKWRKDETAFVEERLDSGVEDAMQVAKIGIVIYDEDFIIRYMSPLFAKIEIDARGQKVFAWQNVLQDLINGSVDSVIVTLKDQKYEVQKKRDEEILFFKDITREYDLEKNYEEEAYILGYLNFDNYDELLDLDGENSVNTSEIKSVVYDYFKRFGIAYKTLRNDRIFLVLNEKIYEELLKEHFTIMNTVKKEAKRLDLSLSVSIALSRGSRDLRELDESALNLLDLAQTRGGDQVVVRKIGEDAQYFGGSSEAKEKSSKVKVRVMANTLRNLIVRSSKVIICGHQEMDADCLGAALCMSEIAQSYKKDTYVIARSGGVEMMTKSVMDRYSKELEERHRFISINEALNQLDDNTLVMMVDHHMADISNGQELLKVAKRVAIIDHHRRRADLDTKPVLVYIEASASSSCELLSEFMPYLLRRNPINEIEANIMYLGMLIDTNQFRVRTGSRTFDAAARLRNLGADPMLCESLKEEPYEVIRQRALIIDNSILYKEGLLISALEEGVFNRTVIAQAGDEMLKTKGIRAVFVIARIASDEVAVSARSKNGFNVQMVMEKINGGGHMTAAGLQSKEFSVLELKAQLLEAIEAYLKGEEESASNT